MPRLFSAAEWKPVRVSNREEWRASGGETDLSSSPLQVLVSAHGQRRDEKQRTSAPAGSSGLTIRQSNVVQADFDLAICVSPIYVYLNCTLLAESSGLDE